MPTFDTPEPISVTIELSAGAVTINAGDRSDTVVEVRPTDESDDSDVKAAEQTRVEYAGGALLVKSPKARALDFSRKSRSVEVTIELPAGSHVHGEAAMADFLCAGRLGQCTVKTSAGHLQLDETGALQASTGAGNVSVDHAVGEAEISTGSGKLHVGVLEGGGAIKNSNGATEIDTVTGQLRVRAANGDISIARSAAGVDAKTANGSIRVDEAAGGSLVLETAMGNLEVGVRQGSAAWLDVKTRFGRVHQNLRDVEPSPAPTGEALEVRARTSFGDITIRRA
jgi:Putative adhesin